MKRSRISKIVHMSLRLPADVHAALKQRADLENRSLNSLYIVLLSQCAKDYVPPTSKTFTEKK